MLGGKHLFGQQADNAPLDCVYWWPISVTPPPPPPPPQHQMRGIPGRGDEIPHKQLPSLWFHARTVSKLHWKRLRASFVFFFNTTTIWLYSLFPAQSFFCLVLDIWSTSASSENREWKERVTILINVKDNVLKNKASCLWFNFARVCTCDKHRCVVGPLE